MKTLLFAAAVGLAAAALSGCGGGTTAPPQAGSEGVPRLESFCNVDGLAPSVRQTVLVIDQQAVQKAASAELIRTTNPELFQLVIGLAAVDGVERGTMAPRERLTAYLAPVDGSAPKLIFNGCAPGLSPDELKKMAAGASGFSQAAGSFLGSSPAQKAAEEAQKFQTALLGALVRVTTDAPAPQPASGILERSFMRSLQSAPQLAPPENGVPRLFLFTDLAAFAPEGLGGVEAARGQGFADADKAHLPLGRAEVHLVGPKPARDPNARQYAQAFFLGSEGRLLSWGGATFSALPPPPVKLDEYSGDIDYPPNHFPAQIRLATDRNGALVDSWFIVKKERSVSTPLTGSLTCDADQLCKITTDQGGFAQAWSKRQGADPDFASDLPLGGLRQLTGEVRNGALTGKIFDPMIGQIGATPGVKSLDFKMTRSAEARF